MCFMLVCFYAAVVVLSVVHWITEQYVKHAVFDCLSSSVLWENLLGLVEFCVLFGSALEINHGFVIWKFIIHCAFAVFVEKNGKHILQEVGLKKKKGPSYSGKPVECYPQEF